MGKNKRSKDSFKFLQDIFERRTFRPTERIYEQSHRDNSPPTHLYSNHQKNYQFGTELSKNYPEFNNYSFHYSSQENIRRDHQNYGQQYNRSQQQFPYSNSDEPFYSIPFQNPFSNFSSNHQSVSQQTLNLPLSKHLSAMKPNDSTLFSNPFDTKNLNMIVQNCIDKITESKQHVCLDSITDALDTYHNIQNIAPKELLSLSCVADVNRILQRINLNILSYVNTRTVSTLHDLQIFLTKNTHSFLPGHLQKRLSPSKCFEDLKVGPLTSFPLIKQLFQVPEGQGVFQVTAKDVINLLHDFLNQNGWSEEVETEKLMKYIQNIFNQSDPLLLGIRIGHMSAVVSALKKNLFQRNNEMRDEMREFRKDVSKSLKTAVDNFRFSVLNNAGEKMVSIREEALYSNPVNLLKSFLAKLHYMYSQFEKIEENNTDLSTKKKKAKFNKGRMSVTVSTIRDLMLKDELTASLFQIAMLSNQNEIAANMQMVFKDARDLYHAKGDKTGWKKNDDEDDDDDGDLCLENLAGDGLSRDAIEEAVLDTIKERWANKKQISLLDLLHLETEILKKYNAASFERLSNKTFLQFLMDGSETKKYLDSIALSSSSSSSSSSPPQISSSSSSLLNPSRKDITFFIKQCLHFHTPSIKESLIQHYKVKDFKLFCQQADLNQLYDDIQNNKDLNITIDNIINNKNNMGSNNITNNNSKDYIDNNNNRNNNNNNNTMRDEELIYGSNLKVVYEEALVTHQLGATGLLGHITTQQALNCLHNCPLLADLHQYSNWSSIFQSQLGDLKSFIIQYGGVVSIRQDAKPRQPIETLEIVALETDDGRLLKLALKCDWTDLEKGVISRDARQTIGHIVSAMVCEGGVRFFSGELYVNKLKVALIKEFMSVGEEGGGVDGGDFGIQDTKKDFNDADARQENKVSIDPNAEAEQSCDFKLPKKPTNDLKKSTTDNTPHDKDGGVKKTQRLQGAQDLCEDLVRFVLECVVLTPKKVATFLVPRVFLEVLNDIVGNTKSKNLLLTAAEKDATKLEYLSALGLSLGIPQWYEEVYNTKLQTNMGTKSNKRCLSHEDDDAVAKKLKIEDDDDGDDDDVELINECDFKKNKVGVKIGGDDSDTSSDDSDCYIKITEAGAKNHAIVGNEKRDASDLNKTNDDQSSDVTTHDVKGGDASGYKKTITGSEPVVSGGDVFNEDNPQHWKELVDKIRKKEFGVGVALGSEGQILLDKQQERLCRSLQRLSADLYSKNTHYVLELVQNADDNNYSHDPKCRPSLVFKVSTDGVEVLNNERGFRSQDLKAVCDVGKTTKGKHMVGYIGQKGIGFKSIYRVTDRPQIHSRGLHVSFDVNSKPLGYIVPQWLDEAAGSGVTTFEGRSYRTRIVLPIKNSLKDDLSIKTSFSDLHPSLLLFLHRLKRIIVADQVSGETRSMSRHDLSDNIVLIKHNNKSEKWVLIRRRVDVSEVSDEAKSGVDIQSTEIAMAFPLKRGFSAKEGANGQLPAKMPVFAFLPLRSYGFRFIIHADFDIPSSREDVHDSLWNQWLRSKLHLLFIDALHFFRHTEHLPVDDFLNGDDAQMNVSSGGNTCHGAAGMDTTTPIITSSLKTTTPPTTTPHSVLRVANFLRFLPQPGEVLDFFRHVSFNIINALKTAPCLPSCDGDWCLPSQLLTCADLTTQHHIPCQLLHQQTGLKYIHPYISASLEASLLLQLGVQRLNAKHVCEVGKAVVKMMTDDVKKFKAIQDSSIDQLSTWLSCIYRHTSLPTIDLTCPYDLDDVNADVIKDLKKMSFIPLSGGRLVSLSSCQSVFFPFRSPVGSSSLSQETMQVLEKELEIIDHRLLSSTNLHKEDRKYVTWVLEKIGVKDMYEDDVIDNHILPILRHQKGSMESDPKVYVAYTHCLKARFCASPNPMLQAPVLLPIFTNRGLKIPCNDDVHFGDGYSSGGSLADHISTFDWTMVDTCYLGDNQSHSNVESWREFFLALGVRDFLCFRKKTRIVTRKVAMDTFPGHVDAFPANLNSFRFEDYTCSELIAVLKSVRENKDKGVRNEELKKIFHLMNSYWSEDGGKNRRSHNSYYYLNYVSNYFVAKLYPDDGVEEKGESNGNDNKNINIRNYNISIDNREARGIQVPSSVEVYLKNTAWLPVYIIHHNNVVSLDSIISCKNNTLFLEKGVEMGSNEGDGALEISPFIQDPLKIMVESPFIKRFSRVAELKLVKCGVNIVGLCPQNFFYFAHHVSYTVLCAEEMNSKMAEFFGIRLFVDKNLVVEIFEQWTRKYGGEGLGEKTGCNELCGKEKALFADTYGRISRIYKFLETHLTKAEKVSLVEGKRFVFVKDAEVSEVNDAMCPGWFVSEDKVCWSDGNKRCRDFMTDILLLGNFTRLVSLKQTSANDENDYSKVFIPFVLSHIYPAQLESFFLHELNIAPHPSIHVFLFFLIQIPAIFPLKDKSHSDIIAVMSCLWDSLHRIEEESDRSMMVINIINIIKDLKVLPASTWLTLSDSVVLLDDYHLKNIFSEVTNVCAINMLSYSDKDNKTSFRNALEANDVSKNAFDFLRLLGVETLTKCVSKNVMSEKSENSEFLKDYLFCMLPYVQKMLKWEFPTVYAHFMDFIDIKQLLRKMKCVQTQSLKLVYRLCIPANHLLPTKSHFLKSSSAQVVQSCYLCDRTFYMNSRSGCSYSQLNSEIAGYFSLVNNHNLSEGLRKVSESCCKELKTLLTEVSSLMLSDQQDQLTRLEAERGYKPLPSDEDWASCISFTKNDVVGGFNAVAANEDVKGDLQPQNIPSKTTQPNQSKPFIQKSRYALSRVPDVTSTWPPTSDEAGFGVGTDAICSKGVQSSLFNLANLSTTTTPSSSTSYKNFTDLPLQTPRMASNAEEGIAPLPEDLGQAGAASEAQKSVGRDGELMVVRYLQEIMKMPNSDIRQVIHMNANEDTVAPFDVKVVLSSGREVFIEVKATSGQNKRWFEVSLQELSYAVRYGKDYHVYRVSGVGRNDAKLLRIENLKETLISKQARLAVVLNAPK